MSKSSSASQNRRTVILLAAAAALGVLVLADRFVFSPDAGVGAVRPAPVQSAAPRSFEPYLDELSADAPALSRPLFAVDRRPDRRRPVIETSPVQPAPVAAPEPAAPPDVRVLGIAVDAAGGGSALIAVRGAAAQRVYAGEDIDGWRIDAVTPEGVVLVRGQSRWRIPVAPVR